MAENLVLVARAVIPPLLSAPKSGPLALPVSSGGIIAVHLLFSQDITTVSSKLAGRASDPPCRCFIGGSFPEPDSQCQDTSALTSPILANRGKDKACEPDQSRRKDWNPACMAYRILISPAPYFAFFPSHSL